MPTKDGVSFAKAEFRIRECPSNPPDADFRSLGQITFPDADDTPAGFPQRAVHDQIPLLVRRQLALPERTIVLRLRCVFWAAVPETAVHEKSETHLLENEIWFDVKGRAVLPRRPISGRAALLRRREVWAAQQRGPTNFNVPPPSADAMRSQQLRQRQFRVLVPAPANPRHHLGTLLFGKDISHNSKTLTLISPIHTNPIRGNSRLTPVQTTRKKSRYRTAGFSLCSFINATTASSVAWNALAPL